jgi:effector-binding domain-containing protein
MDSSVRIVRVEAIHLAVVRHRISRNQLSKVVPEACGIVWNALKAVDVKGAGRHVALYLSATDGLLEVEIGAEVPATFLGSCEVIVSETPSGEAVTATHFGPYGTLGRTHEAIKALCSQRGLPLDGRSWEIYGHWLPEWNTDPSKIRADIFYLLKL